MLPKGSQAIIFLDCSYSFNMVEEAIRDNNGDKYKKNQSIFVQIKETVKNGALDLTIQQVRGHGPEAPEHLKRADKLAKAAAIGG